MLNLPLCVYLVYISNNPFLILSLLPLQIILLLPTLMIPVFPILKLRLDPFFLLLVLLSHMILSIQLISFLVRAPLHSCSLALVNCASTICTSYMMIRYRIIHTYKDMLCFFKYFTRSVSSCRSNFSHESPSPDP